MIPEPGNNLRFQIGHVFFIDIVGYSKLLIEEEKERLRQPTEIVLATAQVRESTNEQLVRLPTGDGMALVFRNSSEEPALCALQIAQALKACPEVLVRMGVHSGPVSEVIDLDDRTNIVGAGNMAQRSWIVPMPDISCSRSESLKTSSNPGIGGRSCTISASARSGRSPGQRR